MVYLVLQNDKAVTVHGMEAGREYRYSSTHS